jgi:hypothetical protein
METFIVRFYRRAHTPAEDAVGTVEHVGSGRRAGFTGERELLERLFGGADAAAAPAPPSGAPDEPNPQPGR